MLTSDGLPYFPGWSQCDDRQSLFECEECGAAVTGLTKHEEWHERQKLAPHGSGMVGETLRVNGEPSPLLVSEDASHVYFRGRIYALEVDSLDNCLPIRLI